MRETEINRITNETEINLCMDIDGSGVTKIDTCIGFFDHMLDAMCRFGQLDLELKCRGDVDVDEHHTIEDVGICLGKALKDALGDRRGICRTASAYVPMDEALAFAAVDVSGRPYLHYECDFATPACGQMGTQMAEEFFRAVCVHAGLTVHLRLLYGRNDHHKLEAMFKAFGKALREAVEYDGRISGVLSTKGTLD